MKDAKSETGLDKKCVSKVSLPLNFPPYIPAEGRREEVLYLRHFQLVEVFPEVMSIVS